MAPQNKPCKFYQQGKCNNGANCTFAHVVDPSFRRKVCPYFAKGKCNRGNQCSFSHDRDTVKDPGHTNGSIAPALGARDNVETRLKEFRWKVPKQLAGNKPLGFALGKFFQQALELVDSEAGTVQEVIALLTSEGGLFRVDELLEQPFSSLGPTQLTMAIDKQLLPFFKIFTHPKVVCSILLRAKVTTVYNIIYTGDGTGQRAILLFSILATHFSDRKDLYMNDKDGQVSKEAMDAIETILAALSRLVDVNTPAHTNSDFVGIVETFAAVLDALPRSAAYDIRNARKSLERLQQRLGIGQSVPEASQTQRPDGARATFQLAREMPGELSEQGPRHDNDQINIQNISILPTLQEIQSSRNEYLPVANPRDWHFGGILGLLDRQFRLLREDTVGQIRDAAKIELERLQNPSRQTDKDGLKRQSARTHVYNNVEIISAEFDEYHGAQVAMRFVQPQANEQESAAARKEWWNNTRRLGPDTLVCLLNSQGSATFFVVAMQGQKPTQLQAEFDLASDPEYAYVVARPLAHSALHSILSQALAGTSYAQLSLVEFPGILLPAFEPTLKAMQRMSESLDVPFKHILAPTSTPDNPEREIHVQPPAYATKPGFKYSLSRITRGNVPLWFSPSNDGNNIEEVASKLADKSTLDLGQARAVISCLAREVGVVQGPPGTGKSYTGVQLIRVLLANKRATNIGPILICTQTNHALDAILERSVDDGVENIVRIGGQSKSERLKDVNLRVLSMQLDLTKTEKTERWELTKKVKEETLEINSLLEAFSSLYTESAIKNYLHQSYPAYHEQLFSSIDEDGFTQVRKSNATILESWLKTSCSGSWRPRSVAELAGVNLHWMTIVERWTLYNSWIVEMKNELDQKLAHALSSYNEAKKLLYDITTELNLRVLNQANIIGVTTSGLARNLELLCGVNSKVLICEEAGEVLEAHMLTALLPSVEHCMLIGDHQQLRPQVQNFDLSSESRGGSLYALDISLFERLVKPQDLFAKPLPFSTLQVQRRMHPSISQLIRKTQYPHLQDDPSVVSYPGIVGIRHRLFWMHHEELEDDKSDGNLTSRTNTFEVSMVAALVKHLVQQGVYNSDDIAVITPYLGQLRKLRKRFSSTHAILLNDRDIDELAKDDDSEDDVVSPSVSGPTTMAKGSLNQAIRLATVDNFQGEEAKVVIISLVRSNQKNNPGFLKTPNRINVLLSRAQHGMYIFGNMKTTENVPMWHDVMEIFRRDGNTGDALELCCPRHQDTSMFVKTPSDFVRLSPEAGCDLLCEKQLQCGHACVAKCHSDMLHEAVFCMKACTKLKKGCQHLCPKPCGDKCDPRCKVPIKNLNVNLACGHIKTTLACYEHQDPSLVVCKEPTKRMVPGCNHEITVPCCIDVDHDKFKCTAPCGGVLSCGHICSRLCFQCGSRVARITDKVDHGSCLQQCDRAHSTCCHRCKSTCHEGESCPPCSLQCDTRCHHARCSKRCSESCSPCLEEQCSSGINCPHNEPCIMPCAAPCTWIPCSERCDRLLSCGCRCPSVCGEECPDAKYCQQHASDDIKSIQADLLMFTSYKDIDLDADPCIFTPCGHIFTIDSLDGTMGMQEYYQVDSLSGKYTGLKSSVEPFSAKDTKPCPECRGSLRSLARYGRIVRRSLLDESAKKLTAWSNRKHHDLVVRLANLEGELMGSINFPLKPTQNILLDGSVETQIKSIKKMKTTKRYAKIYALITEISDFVKKLSKDEQPYKVVHDLVEIARRRTDSESITKFDFSSEELQLREHLQACNLLIRSYLVLFGDVISVHSKTPIGTPRGTLRANFSATRVLCDGLITEAVKSKSINQEIEAQIHWAKLAAMECGIQDAMNEADEPGILRAVDTLKESAKERLHHVEDICARRTKNSKTDRDQMQRERVNQPDDTPEDPMKIFAEEAAEVRRMLRESLSSSEMGMVVQAMAKEFSGTGHWYRCANGHPFTVGECGMPMELARCPECGAGVGGQNHEATEGVTHARDIEETFGHMQL